MWSLRCCPSLYAHPCNPSIEGAGLEGAHLPKHAMRWKIRGGRGMWHLFHLYLYLGCQSITNQIFPRIL